MWLLMHGAAMRWGDSVVQQSTENLFGLVGVQGRRAAQVPYLERAIMASGDQTTRPHRGKRHRGHPPTVTAS